MRRRVLIVPDKFKGTLTAQQAAEAVAKGWKQAHPQDQLTLLPMSDGGDGFGAVMSRLLEAKQQVVETVDAAGRPHAGLWWWAPKTKTAIIETATIIGLAKLPPGRFHPFELDTFGLGRVFKAALRKGAVSTLVGIGGSATNDGGFGLARALGWEFQDRDGTELKSWTELASLDRLVPPGECAFARRIIVAVDVRNPLLGPHGATRIYGPQKGMRPGDFLKAEACLKGLVRVVQRKRGALQQMPGTGAAGGLGYGLAAFTSAKLVPGFDLFARHARLVQRLRDCDLVITGEGAINRSSLMGKGVGEIVNECQSRNLPCIGVAGRVVLSKAARRKFSQLGSLTDLAGEDQAKLKPAYWLEQLAQQLGLET